MLESDAFFGSRVTVKVAETGPDGSAWGAQGDPCGRVWRDAGHDVPGGLAEPAESWFVQEKPPEMHEIAAPSAKTALVDFISSSLAADVSYVARMRGSTRN